MSDYRIEAAALALLSDKQWPTNEELGGGPTGTRDDEVRDQYMDDARDALAAADAVDAGQGIHRVKVDDAAVDRVAQVFYDAVNPQGRYRTTSPQVRDHYLTTARAAITALTEALR